VRRADPFIIRLAAGGLLRPKDTRIGGDVAGQVEAVGENVEQFKVGDEVFGCRHGAFAEYVTAREGLLTLKPDKISFEQAAAVPIGALTALQGLRDTGKIQSDQKVLIQGASGGVGIFAVQLAKHFGADVTAVCSTRNVDMVRSLGADRVIDYTKEDFTRNPERWDLIFAVNGYHPISAYKQALNPQGMYVCAGGMFSQFMQAIFLGPIMSQKGGKKVTTMGISQAKQEDLVTLAELLKDGKIRPVIDQTYPLNEIVEAFRYVEDVHAQGKVVITIL
jgi:NADPH:quinone reductase-like Zn-dependent oxidoreductase